MLVEMGVGTLVGRHLVSGFLGHSWRLDAHLQLNTGTAKSDEQVVLPPHSSPDPLGYDGHLEAK